MAVEKKYAFFLLSTPSLSFQFFTFCNAKITARFAYMLITHLINTPWLQMNS